MNNLMLVRELLADIKLKQKELVSSLYALYCNNAMPSKENTNMNGDIYDEDFTVKPLDILDSHIMALENLKTAYIESVTLTMRKEIDSNWEKLSFNYEDKRNFQPYFSKGFSKDNVKLLVKELQRLGNVAAKDEKLTQGNKLYLEFLAHQKQEYLTPVKFTKKHAIKVNEVVSGEVVPIPTTSTPKVTLSPYMINPTISLIRIKPEQMNTSMHFQSSFVSCEEDIAQSRRCEEDTMRSRKCKTITVHVRKSNRRKRQDYSLQEVKFILQGVCTYKTDLGIRWNQILNYYRFKEGRTAIDLSDKYKQMNRGRMNSTGLDVSLPNLEDKQLIIKKTFTKRRSFRKKLFKMSQKLEKTI